MKTKSVKAVFMAITIICLVGTMFCSTIFALNGEVNYVSDNKSIIKEKDLYIRPSSTLDSNSSIEDLALEINVDELRQINIAKKEAEEAEAKRLEEIKAKEEAEAKKNEIVYDGMTLDELAAKLDRSLNSTISGQGYTFASLATELGVDPYLAVAIVMHETGCKWECSTLLKQCNNVGGMKGSSGCNGGAYASFATLEEGINAYMNNLYKNYFAQGLTTAEAMQSKYAASSTWATQVNSYINSIKAA